MPTGFSPERLFTDGPAPGPRRSIRNPALLHRSGPSLSFYAVLGSHVLRNSLATRVNTLLLVHGLSPPHPETPSPRRGRHGTDRSLSHRLGPADPGGHGQDDPSRQHGASPGRGPSRTPPTSRTRQGGRRRRSRYRTVAFLAQADPCALVAPHIWALPRTSDVRQRRGPLRPAAASAEPDTPATWLHVAINARPRAPAAAVVAVQSSEGRTPLGPHDPTLGRPPCC